MRDISRGRNMKRITSALRPIVKPEVSTKDLLLERGWHYFRVW